MKLITVFTPTYNRGQLLKICYRSLVIQSSHNFIWQIIDDGSCDDTKEIVDEFVKENILHIEYVYKSNGGKVAAINKSLEITNTELWFCLDSDDYLFPNAIEIIEKKYNEIMNIDNVCGLFTYRCQPNGRPMQNKDIPMVGSVLSQFDMRYKYNFPPEYVQVYKTNIINKYRYPLFENEKYIPLSYMQDQIDQRYKFLIIDEKIMVCEYQNDGITKNQKRLICRNPKGYKAFKRQQIEISPGIIFKIKSCIAFDTACILSNSKDYICDSPCRFLTILCYPLALIDYLIRYRLFK